MLQLDGFAGAIFGNAPLFEQFYVGDFSRSPARPRRSTWTSTGAPAPNYLNTDIVEVRYGQYAAKLDAEYRVPLYRGTRSIYGVDFFGARRLRRRATRRTSSIPPRGYTGFAHRADRPHLQLGLRVDTQAGGFVFGISNFIGFMPVARGASP